MKRNPAYDMPHNGRRDDLAGLRPRAAAASDLLSDTLSAGVERSRAEKLPAGKSPTGKSLVDGSVVEGTVRRVRGLLERLSPCDTEEQNSSRLERTLAAKDFAAEVVRLERQRASLAEHFPEIDLPELSDYVVEVKARLAGDSVGPLHRRGPGS